MNTAMRILQRKVNREVAGKTTKCLYCGRPGDKKCCGACYSSLSVETKILTDREEQWVKAV